MYKASTHVRIAPRKVKIVADLIRHKPFSVAVGVLENVQKSASLVLKKLIKSAAANASHNGGVDVNGLYVLKIDLGHGTTLKRMHPRAKGRGCRINKYTTNIFVELAEIPA